MLRVELPVKPYIVVYNAGPMNSKDLALYFGFLTSAGSIFSLVKPDSVGMFKAVGQPTIMV